MDINATVDVGDNITGMLERLAAQLGTTAGKVFPWYVQQAYLEGVTTLYALGLFLAVSLALLAIFARSAKLSDEGPNVPALACIAGGLLLFFSVMGTALEGTDAVRKIANPNYYAMKMMTQDIGRLVRR